MVMPRPAKKADSRGSVSPGSGPGHASEIMCPDLLQPSWMADAVWSARMRFALYLNSAGRCSDSALSQVR
jgi:hypothetical protein